LANVAILFVEAAYFVDAVSAAAWCQNRDTILLSDVISGVHWLLASLCLPAGRQLSAQLQLIKPCAGNTGSRHTKIHPASTASERLSSGCVFVCIVVSVKFVRVPFLLPYVLVVPDIRNVILFVARCLFCQKAPSHLSEGFAVRFIFLARFAFDIIFSQSLSSV